jgi:hypothetical protein
MKKFFITLLVLLIVALSAVWHYRFEIFQTSAESLVRKHLPAYVTVKKIFFDLRNNRLEIGGLEIKNPPGYSHRALASVDTVTCLYALKGKTILSGIEVTGIKAARPRINIERRPDKRMNVNEMGRIMEEASSPVPADEGTESQGFPLSKEKKAPENRGKLSDFIKLTDTIDISNGTVIFLDEAVPSGPCLFTFKDINGDLVIGLNDDYSAVVSVASNGKGFVDGDTSESVKWAVSLDPTQPKLTMASRFEAEGLEITRFKPYYDKYSPVDIQSGYFSGTLIFDFDHGNIGAMNTLVLKHLRFKQRRGGEYGSAWQTDMLPKIVEYLQSAPDEVTFDFKVKGTMERPEFYPGPRVKEALQNAVVGTITDAVRGLSGGGSEGGKGDVGKVMDALKGFLKK